MNSQIVLCTRGLPVRDRLLLDTHYFVIFEVRLTSCSRINELVPTSGQNGRRMAEQDTWRKQNSSLTRCWWNQMRQLGEHCLVLAERTVMWIWANLPLMSVSSWNRWMLLHTCFSRISMLQLASGRRCCGCAL